MSAPWLLLGLRSRLGRLLISLGFGPSIVTPLGPTIITGPCIDGALGDPSIFAALLDPSAGGAVLSDLVFAGAFGDVMIAGVLSEAEIEGVAIDVC